MRKKLRKNLRDKVRKKKVIEYTPEQLEEYAKKKGYRYLANSLHWPIWNPHTGLEEPEEKDKKKQKKKKK